MRASLAVFLLSLSLAAVTSGCTPYIPVKPGFGTSALAPGPNIPPEFAEFNNYNPGVNPLLAAQICATPVEPLEAKTLGADSGSLDENRYRCANHQPFLGIYQ